MLLTAGLSSRTIITELSSLSLCHLIGFLKEHLYGNTNYGEDIPIILVFQISIFEIGAGHVVLD